VLAECKAFFSETPSSRNDCLPSTYAIRAARASAPEEEREEAGRLECRWQREQLPSEIRELALDDQRLRNEKGWSLLDC